MHPYVLFKDFRSVLGELFDGTKHILELPNPMASIQINEMKNVENWPTSHFADIIRDTTVRIMQIYEGKVLYLDPKGFSLNLKSDDDILYFCANITDVLFLLVNQWFISWNSIFFGFVSFVNLLTCHRCQWFRSLFYKSSIIHGIAWNK